MATIVETSSAFPPHYFTQDELAALLREAWADSSERLELLDRFHRAVEVAGRYIAIPPAEYVARRGFGARNEAWQRVALSLGEQAVRSLLERADLPPEKVDELAFTTVTGLSVPSIDARLMNRIPFRPDCRRLPFFGLGCVAGSAGVARLADALAGRPGDAALLLSVELCSLTIQLDDLSVPNLVSASLFGDGAAAVLVVGDEHPLAGRGPRVVATQSIFFPDTEKIMGWDVTDSGFKILLSAGVPKLTEERLRPAVDDFLAAHDLAVSDISHWIAHPGGPKVLDAIEQALDLEPEALRFSRESLAQVGNLSSASVLLILGQTLALEPEPGRWGVMFSMGPGFCAELLLLRW